MIYPKSTKPVKSSPLNQVMTHASSPFEAKAENTPAKIITSFGCAPCVVSSTPTLKITPPSPGPEEPQDISSKLAINARYASCFETSVIARAGSLFPIVEEAVEDTAAETAENNQCEPCDPYGAWEDAAQDLYDEKQVARYAWANREKALEGRIIDEARDFRHEVFWNAWERQFEKREIEVDDMYPSGRYPGNGAYEGVNAAVDEGHGDKEADLALAAWHEPSKQDAAPISLAEWNANPDNEPVSPVSSDGESDSDESEKGDEADEGTAGTGSETESSDEDAGEDEPEDPSKVTQNDARYDSSASIDDRNSAETALTSCDSHSRVDECKEGDEADMGTADTSSFADDKGDDAWEDEPEEPSKASKNSTRHYLSTSSSDRKTAKTAQKGCDSRGNLLPANLEAFYACQAARARLDQEEYAISRAIRHRAKQQHRVEVNKYLLAKLPFCFHIQRTMKRVDKGSLKLRNQIAMRSAVRESDRRYGEWYDWCCGARFHGCVSE